jgi:hypothetical protein
MFPAARSVPSYGGLIYILAVFFSFLSQFNRSCSDNLPVVQVRLEVSLTSLDISLSPSFFDFFFAFPSLDTQRIEIKTPN